MSPRPDAPTPVAERVVARGWRTIFLGVSRANLASQVVAGVTLLAIAIPEQLATSRLAGVPAFVALIAFVTATLVFVAVGSNPIVSVGADSTIAPLFAVAFLRVAAPSTAVYMELAAATAVLTGLVLAGIGLARLGWIADFLSLPIVTGFVAGIGVTIIVHQLPDAFGVAGGGSTVYQRLDQFFHVVGTTNGPSLVIAAVVLALLVAGERWNARVPWALVAILGASIVAEAASLARHGVTLLGPVAVSGPAWHLRWLSGSQWSLVAGTSVTLVIVVLSQTAATTRNAADELGVATDVGRDFLGVGLANVAAGLVGAFPVNASPARTTVSRLAGGSTKLVGATAAVLLIALSPLVTYARTIPLAALAGVLFFIAARLIKVTQLSSIWRTSRVEFVFAIVTLVGVIVIGVDWGLGLAVALAVAQQTARTARPHLIELGRREGTTSWEPLPVDDVKREKHIVVALFDHDLFFANAAVFHRSLHALLQRHPHCQLLVLDCVAIADIDFTGLTTLGEIVDDLAREGLRVRFARANENVRRTLGTSSDPAVRAIPFYESVDAAVTAPSA